jgi:hypothetical protein
MNRSSLQTTRKVTKSFGLAILSGIGLLLVLVFLEPKSLEQSFEKLPEWTHKETQVKIQSRSSKNEPAYEQQDILDKEQEAFRTFPHLAQSFRMTHKVLKTEAEWDAMRTLHSDGKAIESSTDYLLQESNYDTDLSLVHFRHLDFLKQSLSLEASPSEAFLHEKIARILLFEPEQRETWSESQQQMWLGNKIDLIYAMKAYAPDALLKIVEDAGDKRLEKLIAYAEQKRAFLQMVEL